MSELNDAEYWTPAQSAARLSSQMEAASAAVDEVSAAHEEAKILQVLDLAEQAIRSIEIGNGNEGWRFGRETMRDDAIAALRDLGGLR